MLPVFLIILQLLSPAQESVLQSPALLSDGEVLLYEVSWSRIKIGTIRLQVLPHRVKNGAIHYQAKATIDSYKLPFIDLHFIAYAEMDSLCNSIGSWSFEKKDDQWETLVYGYQMERHRILVAKTLQEKPELPSPSLVPDTLFVPEFPVQDGISMLYFARLLTRKLTAVKIPAVSMGKMGEVEFYKDRERTSVEIDALKQPVRVVKFSGKLHVEGILGLTGDFTGWFSDDEAAVPITAKLKFILGNVSIELKQWKRASWQPPVK
ncbi:MAG TPA: DUF3108 domain-containing protein [Bacteroidota bacterium]|nr:DUF3108 domain-containing protein [Bacteroidota bacterium]